MEKCYDQRKGGLSMLYNEITKHFELKRKLNPNEIKFIKWMIKNQKQKRSA
jgi:hypothetical protein